MWAAATVAATTSSAKTDKSADFVVGRVVVASDPPSHYIPSASEAPELLLSSSAPSRPFFSRRRAQIFFASCCVGAASVATIYFFLGKGFSTSAEEERAAIDEMERRSRAVHEAPQVLPSFTSPSSYDELRAKMERKEREMERLSRQLASETSTLHTEALYHTKMWWNRCLTNLQAAVAYYTRLQRTRQERVAMANVERTLRDNGYRVVSLRKAGEEAST